MKLSEFIDKVYQLDGNYELFVMVHDVREKEEDRLIGDFIESWTKYDIKKITIVEEHKHIVMDIQQR